MWSGLNFVQPEDATLSMSEYNRQMHMLDYLHSVYPKVHISLHAGELAPGLVPPDGIEVPHSRGGRAGPRGAHRTRRGRDVRDGSARAAAMKWPTRHVMVEINLTSNDVILGVVPPHHPLPEYRAAHVPGGALHRRRGRLAHRPDA